MAWSTKKKFQVPAGWETDPKCKAWISWLDEGNYVPGPLKDGEVPLVNVFNNVFKDIYAVRLRDGRIRNIKTGKVLLSKADDAGYYSFHTRYKCQNYKKKWARVVRFAGGDLCPGMEIFYHADHLKERWMNGFYDTRWLLHTQNLAIENKIRELEKAQEMYLYDCLTGEFIAWFPRKGAAEAFLHRTVHYSKGKQIFSNGFIVSTIKTEKVPTQQGIRNLCVKVTSDHGECIIFRNTNSVYRFLNLGRCHLSFKEVYHHLKNLGYTIEHISGFELYNELVKFNSGEPTRFADDYFTEGAEQVSTNNNEDTYVNMYCDIVHELLTMSLSDKNVQSVASAAAKLLNYCKKFMKEQPKTQETTQCQTQLTLLSLCA